MRFADSADDNDKLGGGTEKYKTKIAINSNGSCKWMAPAIFQSTCDINTEFFPFDDQVRHLIICTYLVIQVLCLLVPHDQHICVGSESKSILLFTSLPYATSARRTFANSVALNKEGSKMLN